MVLPNKSIPQAARSQVENVLGGTVGEDLADFPYFAHEFLIVLVSSHVEHHLELAGQGLAHLPPPLLFHCGLLFPELLRVLPLELLGQLEPPLAELLKRVSQENVIADLNEDILNFSDQPGAGESSAALSLLLDSEQGRAREFGDVLKIIQPQCKMIKVQEWPEFGAVYQRLEEAAGELLLACFHSTIYYLVFTSCYLIFTI